MVCVGEKEEAAKLGYPGTLSAGGYPEDRFPTFCQFSFGKEGSLCRLKH